MEGMAHELTTFRTIILDNKSTNGTIQLGSNDSNEIAEMSELLRNFYKDFGKGTNYALVGLYVPVIPIAIVANILVILVVFKNDYMRSATSYFVVNLSVADLLVTIICMPMAISHAISIVGLYEEIICKLVFYLQGVAVAASVFTIMVMSIDRYLAIKYPIVFRRFFNRRRMTAVIVAIWVVSLSIFGPLLKAVTIHRLDRQNITLGMQTSDSEFKVVVFQPPSISVCSEDLKSFGVNASVFGIACFVIVYAIPVSVVLILYLMMGRTLYTRKPPFDTDSIRGSTSLQQGFRLVRERKRVAWTLLTLAVLFTLCWFPYNMLRLLLDLGTVAESKWIAKALSYCLFLGHANSMLNPLVYCLMTRTFRRSISEILCRCRCVSTQCKSRRNTLAVGACACSSLGEKNPNSAGNRQRRSCAQAERERDRIDATTSSTCESFNSKHDPHRRCFMYTNESFQKNTQDPQITAVSRGRQDSLTNFTVSRTHHSNDNWTLKLRPNEARPDRHSKASNNDFTNQ